MNLPSHVYLDWTYGGTWRLPDILIQDGRYPTLEALFLDVVSRRRSVAVVEPIRPESLRIRMADSPPDNPTEWRMLIGADASQVYRGAV